VQPLTPASRSKLVQIGFNLIGLVDVIDDYLSGFLLGLLASYLPCLTVHDEPGSA